MKPHLQNPPEYRHDTVLRLHPEVQSQAWAVDAACSGNPGPMEYRCINLNNIGEFLAIVHALALLEQCGENKTIYSDSHNAILWINKKKCKTTLVMNSATEKTHQLIVRAETWLRTHNVSTPVLKWKTREWGEIPADFGRK